MKSLCKFFAIVPSLKRTNLEYENLVKEILGRLWNIIQWSDKHSIEYATDALKSYNYDQMTLDTIPDAYREGIALPEAPQGMEISILDLEVPGECFVQLLCKVSPVGLEAVSGLLCHYISCEIEEFRSGHYLVKEGQREPLNYKNLHKQSILKALTHFVVNQATTKKADKLVGEAVLVAALKVLAKRYKKQLPPIDWCFLHELLFKSEDLKAQSLRIAAKQSIISGTAKRLIENFLVNLDPDDADDVTTALESLGDLCNGVSPDVLKTFFDFIFKNQGIESTAHVISCLKEEQHVTNRENLAVLMISYMKHVELTPELAKLIPPKVLDAISPQLTLPQKTEFRCEILKSNASVENPVAWVNELVSDHLTSTSHRELFIDSFTKVLTASDVFPKKKWIADFILIMQNRMVEADSNADFQFMLEIFIISVVVASGYYKTVENEEIRDASLKIFPQSVQLVSRQSLYDDISGRIFEFLLHVISTTTSDEIREAFRSAIIVSKNHAYFKAPKAWKRFLFS